MKKIIAVALAAFALNASAFTGTGNENIELARAFMHFVDKGNSGTTDEISGASIWVGRVAGMSSVYTKFGYKYSICYPNDATSGQLAEIAAKYLIENPNQRAESLAAIVWIAHFEAFGVNMSDECFQHDRWAEYTSKG